MTRIDPRGPRFGAAVTSVLLAATLLLGSSPAGIALLATVTAMFALGAVRGTQGTLQGLVFRRWLQPRLAPPPHLEDARPPQFAQAVGLLVTGTGLLLAAVGVPGAILGAAAIALAAAFANATFGFCLGCEMYLLLRRARPV